MLKNALLLIGSPNFQSGASATLGQALLARLHERGMETASLAINQVLLQQDGIKTLQEAAADVDLLLLSYPLYVDSLPALTIEALQWIAQSRKAGKQGKPAGFAAMANCGFPEAYQAEVSLQICRQFAREAAIPWLGGLAMGMGGMVTGGNFNEQNGMFAPVFEALNLAAEALVLGEEIPEQARENMAKNLFPPILYRLGGNLQFRAQKNQNKVKESIQRRPFERPED